MRRYSTLKMIMATVFLAMTCSVGIAKAQKVSGVVFSPEMRPVKDATIVWVEHDFSGDITIRETVRSDASGKFSFASEGLKKENQRNATLLASAPSRGERNDPVNQQQ